MNRKLLSVLFVLTALIAKLAADRDNSTKPSSPPRVQGFGNVTRFAEALEQPRDGSKIMVDLIAGGPPDLLNKRLEKIARFVNIYSQAGRKPASAPICVVLHGDATGLALNDSAYVEVFGATNNPTLKLLRKLHQADVEFLVCGQAMTAKGYELDQILKGIQVALSGLTALVNRQEDGYAYIPLSE